MNAAAENFDSLDGGSLPRVWLRAFWGFEPEKEGYLGFTHKGNQRRFLSLARRGDLVLIYGATSVETERDARRQALGFLEVDPISVTDVERTSAEGLHWKHENGLRDRWTHGVIVRRAWRIRTRIEVKFLAPETYVHPRARLIASRSELLTPKEAADALKLPVTPANVFGEAPLAPDAFVETDLASVFRPSRGIPPSFGKRESEYEDGQHFLYILKAEGDVAALLGRNTWDIGSRCLVKVGYSRDPRQRCADHNAALPPAGVLRWQVYVTSKAYPDGQSAKLAEDAMKAAFDKQFKSLGREFFLGDLDQMTQAFSVIRGAGYHFGGSGGPSQADARRRL